MKKFFTTILKITAVLAIGGVVLMPELAIAASVTNYMEGIAVSGINSALAWLANWLLMFTAWLLSVCGLFLSVSINMSINIKDIFFSSGSNSSIESIWRTVRDLSSIFIIFALLYYSIMTILGFSKSGLNQLIVNVFLAGILINFSLFFVRVAVDASNLVSLQFYNAIAPDTSRNWTAGMAWNDGGLSNVFMQSLKIPKIYESKDVLKGSDVAAGIGFAALGGVLMMVIAGISFLAAGIAFTIRTAIILFVMALSPLYFAGMIFPKIKAKVSDRLLDLLVNQLIFMPAYLFCLYIALRIISDPSFMNIFNLHVAAGNQWGALSMSVILQYTIAIMFISAPLIVGISLGGIGMKWAPGGKDIGKAFGGVIGRNTAGRFTRKLGKSYDEMAANGTFLGSKSLATYGGKIMNVTNISPAIRKGLKSAEDSKYGSSINLSTKEKETKTREKDVAAFGRKQEQKKKMALYLAIPEAKRTSAHLDDFRKAVSGVDVKELQDMDFDKLNKPEFASSIPSGKFESLLKELSPAEQDQLKATRKKGFEEILTKHGANYLIKTALDGKPVEIAKLHGDILKKEEVSVLLDPAVLRKMVDENVSETIREKVRNNIMDAATRPNVPPPQPGSPLEKSFKYLDNNFVF